MEGCWRSMMFMWLGLGSTEVRWTCRTSKAPPMNSQGIIIHLTCDGGWARSRSGTTPPIGFRIHGRETCTFNAVLAGLIYPPLTNVHVHVH